MSLVIAWIDLVTGEDLDFFILYFIPVSVAAWYGGPKSGIAIAVLAAGVWFDIDWHTDQPYVWTIGEWDTAVRLVAFLTVSATLSRIRSALTEQKRLNAVLTDAMAQIKQLRGILPMCSLCKKIRDVQERWIPLERYISEHSDAQLSHGLCPHCFKKFYGSENGT